MVAAHHTTAELVCDVKGHMRMAEVAICVCLSVRKYMHELPYAYGQIGERASKRTAGESQTHLSKRKRRAGRRKHASGGASLHQHAYDTAPAIKTWRAGAWHMLVSLVYACDYVCMHKLV